MNRERSALPVSSHAGRPGGLAYRGLLFAIPIVLAVPLVAWLGLPRFSLSPEETGPMMCVVRRGQFTHDVTEHGNVESANNVEIRCEVESHGQGTMIIWIIPEGTYVEPVPDWKPTEPGEEPPDLLVKLDSSALEDKRMQQQIVCNSSEAAVIQAKNNFETAKIEKKEYLEGTYQEEKNKVEGQILLAEESLVRQQQYLEDSKLLHAKGFISDRELQGDEYKLEQEKITLANATTGLEVLEKYRKLRNILELDAKINIAEAKLKSEEHSHQLDLDKLAEIEEQIAKCTIRAPQAGQVVYANVTDRRGGQEVIIEEGTMVRERQEIIRLPDPKNMQVKAKINEAKVSMVEKGMAATIELDAFTDSKLTGTVEKVSEYPLPTAWFAGNVKEYETIIRINDFPEDLQMRPGMTAKVSIRVEQLDDVLMVPVQAVFEHGGKHYCVLRNGGEFVAREVVIGSTNDKDVVIRKGLKEGEAVVLGAARMRDELDLPELPPETQLAAQSPGPRLDSTETRKPRGDSESPQEGARPDGAATSDGPRAGGFDPGRMFQALDTNSDGRLEGDEIPDRMKSNLPAIDTDGDGAVDRSEMSAMGSRFRRQGGGRGGPGSGGPGEPGGGERPARPGGGQGPGGPGGRSRSPGGGQGAQQ